jgi:hypothetical protein
VYKEARRRGPSCRGTRAHDRAEAGWILEDDHGMINALTRMGFEACEADCERPI